MHMRLEARGFFGRSSRRRSRATSTNPKSGS
jgi:hypothetical protein